MKILMVGGGSGGHVTPAVAVVREILNQKPRTQIEFWTDKKYYKNVVKITTETELKWRESLEDGIKGSGLVNIKTISAGKFRRYSGWKLWDYFENIEITWNDLIVGNFIGFWGFTFGFFQSFARLFKKSTRPDVIFLKGGFVGLPVGIVAGLLKIPYVIHESDVVMGLANKILSKKATKVTFGQAIDGDLKENQEVVGIPVAEEFKKVTKAKQKDLKKSFGFKSTQPLVVVTGGSQGSRHINTVISQILPNILENASVGLVAGRKNYDQALPLKQYEVWEEAELKSNFRMWEFNNSMHELLGAADIVVARAGATTISELAALANPAVILIPFEKLPGGHQVSNAKKLAKLGAAEVLVDEKMMKNPEKLLEIIEKLINDPEKRAKLSENLTKIAKPDAAIRLAEILIELATKSDGSKSKKSAKL